MAAQSSDYNSTGPHPIQISLSLLCIIIMPSGAKKRKAIKRKKETANHNHPPSSDPASDNSQGNSAADDHDDSSDHHLTDEDFSPRASMYAGTEPEVATSEDASLVPVEHRTVSESWPPEPVEPEALVTTVESHAPLEIGEKSGEGGSHCEGSKIPVSATATRDAPAAEPAPLLERGAVWSNCAADDHDDRSGHPLTDEDFSHRASMDAETEPVVATSEDASLVPVEHRTVSELEPPEPVVVPEALATTVESHAPLEIGEKTCEGGSHCEESEIPVSATATRDALAAGPAPLLERRAVWWNCCGLLDLFGGSQR